MVTLNQVTTYSNSSTAGNINTPSHTVTANSSSSLTSGTNNPSKASSTFQFLEIFEQEKSNIQDTDFSAPELNSEIEPEEIIYIDLQSIDDENPEFMARSNEEALSDYLPASEILSAKPEVISPKVKDAPPSEISSAKPEFISSKVKDVLSSEVLSTKPETVSVNPEIASAKSIDKQQDFLSHTDSSRLNGAGEETSHLAASNSINLETSSEIDSRELRDSSNFDSESEFDSASKKLITDISISPEKGLQDVKSDELIEDILTQMDPSGSEKRLINSKIFSESIVNDELQGDASNINNQESMAGAGALASSGNTPNLEMNEDIEPETLNSLEENQPISNQSMFSGLFDNQQSLQDSEVDKPAVNGFKLVDYSNMQPVDELETPIQNKLNLGAAKAGKDMADAQEMADAVDFSADSDSLRTDANFRNAASYNMAKVSALNKNFQSEKNTDSDFKGLSLKNSFGDSLEIENSIFQTSTVDKSSSLKSSLSGGMTLANSDPMNGNKNDLSVLKLHLSGHGINNTDFSQKNQEVQKSTDMQGMIDKMKDAIKGSSFSGNQMVFHVEDTNQEKMRFRLIKHKDGFKITASSVGENTKSDLMKHLQDLTNSVKEDGIHIAEININNEQFLNF